MLVMMVGVRAATLPAPLPAQGSSPPRTTLDSARHVLDRLAYGTTPGLAEAIARQGVMTWIERQLGFEDLDDPGLRTTLAGFDLLSTPTEELLRQFTEAQRQRRLRQQAGPPPSPSPSPSPGAQPGEAELRRLIAQLPQLVVVRGIRSERQLGEIMADFWFNHFNIFIGKNLDRVYLPEYVEGTIRANALGRFEDLLIATAHSPAMMIYLDNAQSVAPGSEPPAPRFRAVARLGLDSLRRLAEQRRPTGINENYARELLELHSLGVNGGYTQKDVTEVARILTGWSVAPFRPALGRLGGGFVFNPWAHDEGAKTVMGAAFPAGRGEEEGTRLIELLAAHPSTRHFVSAKLCARFVNDDPPDGCVDDAVRAWQQSDGDIRQVLRAIFRSPDFWAPKNIGAKVKSPLEFVVSAVRALGGVPDSTPRLSLAVGRLGQPLYQHVAPNGYGERQEDWVNSGALLNRMNLAMALAANRAPGVSVDLDRVVPLADRAEDLVESVNRTILSGRMSAPTRQVIMNEIAGIANLAQARAMAVGLALGGPEFQRQ